MFGKPTFDADPAIGQPEESLVLPDKAKRLARSPVCTESSNPDVVVMKSAKEGV